jgi:GGDEF domain-containing protein
VNGRVSHRRSARSLKSFSLLYLALVVASLLLVHGAAYEPAVSFILLYLVVSVGVTAAVALLLFPTAQFSAGFCVGAYALYAAVIAMMVFFSGGVSSELYVLFFPLLLASALHGSWRITLAALVAVLFCYALAVLPGLLDDLTGNETAAVVFYRLCSLGLTGVFLVLVARSFFSGVKEAEEYETDEDGSMLLGRVEEELAARRGVQVAVILVDPGPKVEDVALLLERVRARIEEPILLGEGTVFGVVLSGVDDRTVESAARRALAAASSLGAEETRAGVAIYPRDARSAEDLLVAAGHALEAAFEVESPSAIVMAGRNTPRAAHRYRAAR